MPKKALKNRDQESSRRSFMLPKDKLEALAGEERKGDHVSRDHILFVYGGDEISFSTFIHHTLDQTDDET